MKNFPIIVFLLFSLSVQAQLERVIHQTFEIKEDVNTVALNLLDTYEIEKWAGNNIMTVAKIELTGGANHILDFFVKEGRYEMEMKEEETAATLTNILKERKEMNWKNGLVFELVTIKMYVPEDFDLAGEQLVRKAESNETASIDQNPVEEVKQEEKEKVEKKKDNQEQPNEKEQSKEKEEVKEKTEKKKEKDN